MKIDRLFSLSSAVVLLISSIFFSISFANAAAQHVLQSDVVASSQQQENIGKTQLLIIDSEVADKSVLTEGIDRGIEIIEIGSEGDGLIQLSEALKDHSGIAAIHIISHGQPGGLRLAGELIDIAALERHKSVLRSIGNRLADDGDILFYGCRVAEGKDGQDFIHKLVELTGADVQASEDLTGSLAQGGDWVLEYSHGDIESELLIANAQIEAYNKILALPVIGGTAASQAVNDNSTILPFASVTITDTDGHNVTTTVTLDINAKGSFTSASLAASGFTGSGPYTLAATTPANAQTAIRLLSYDPANDRVAPGSTETTGFTISVDDATLIGTDNVTTVVSTSINDNPSFTGTPSITGSSSVGSVLSAANTATTDNDTGDGITLSYQWKSDGINIIGATSNSYTLTAGEAHTTISLDVTGNDDFGGSTGLVTTAGVAVLNTPPSNTGLPLVSGSAVVGGVLSTSDGTWSDVDGDGFSYSYQWRSGGIDIVGATAANYTLTSSEAHTNITVQVTASDGNGGSTSAVSAATAVANSAPANTVLPAISGTATVGNTINTDNGTWSDADADALSYAYQWRSDGVDIVGATASSYNLTSSEAHTTITVQVTASDGNGGSVPMVSAGTAVANTAPSNTLLPVISGTALVGSALTVSNGNWTDVDSDPISYAYQWRADGVDIAGATASGYTLTASEAHATITVRVTASDGNGGSTSVITAGSVVANTAPVNVAIPTISGVSTVGNTLTATDGSWTDADGDGLTYAYQWQMNGVDIGGATSSSFTVTATQAGQLMSIVVTADDGNGGSGTASSLSVAGNSPPVISGSPETTVSGHTAYLFTPVVSDADGDALTFSISNPPVWAQFNVSTGQLSGMPSNNDVGTTSGITISVSDGSATVSLSSFDLSVTENMDIDGDGMPNDWETANGLDPQDPEDATTDLDGDGINNLDEYLATSDPANDDNPPTLTVPDDITVNSVGLFTPVDTGVATAFDELDGELTPTSDAREYYAPGRHIVTWQVSDSAGNTTSGVQTVNVIPLVSFSKSQKSAEGSSVNFRLILNGDAVSYPVSIPYVVGGSASVDGSDHDLVDGIAVIEDGLEMEVSFTTVDDGPGEGVEQIVIAMDSPTNAVEGPVATHTVELFEGNVAPQVSLYAQQGGEQARIIVVGDEPVVVTSELVDPNFDDSHSYDWSATDDALSDIDTSTTTYSFSTEGLSAGIYKVQLSVSDGAEIAKASLTLSLVEDLPDLSPSLDSDGDGLDDASEGLEDGDNDGIPDYLDAIGTANILQGQSAQSSSHLLESEPGIRMSLGDVALQSQDGQANIDTEDLANAGIEADEEYQYSSGLFDFNIDELPVAGQSIQIVIAQFSAIPANAVYRKLMPSGWQDFVVDENNSVASALGAEGFCPPPGDSAYSNGLSEGHWCVQLTIEDGGPNDADGEVNQAIDDPGGVAVKTTSSESSSSSGGGGSNDIVLFLLLSWIVLLRYKTLSLVRLE